MVSHNNMKTSADLTLTPSLQGKGNAPANFAHHYLSYIHGNICLEITYYHSYADE